MGRRKPQKRLVGWNQYVQAMWSKAVGYSGATAVTLCGAGFLILGVMLFWNGLHQEDPTNRASIMQCGIGCCIGSALTIWYATILFSDTRQIEPVELITRHNVQELPVDETLLRGSHRPAIDPQTDLLRATGQEPEAHSEQLLRATQGNRQDT
ncbi:MAG: hypothetical protein JWN14_2594 [Chthonomonadales bacterium]|nr:hypothetical protein [Chthonomonadales bacterium]